jgi:hypothetical protein
MALVKISQGRPNFAIDISPEPIVGISLLGTPLYDKIIFPGGQYTDSDGNVVLYSKLTLDDALITVNLQRNVSITNIVGRKGSVKEFISNGDYEITFSGRISAPWQLQPRFSLTFFSDLMKVEKEISVYSSYLNKIFDITSIVVIGKPQVSQIEGSRNSYNVSFRAVSYEEIQLEVLDDA